MLPSSVAAIWILAIALSTAADPKRDPTEVRMDRCYKTSRELFGEDLSMAEKVQPPKALRTPRPDYPTGSVPGTCSGLSSHVILISPQGRVRGAWIVNEPRCEPPWPELTKAIRAAIWTRQFEPATVDGRPVPICALAMTIIDWR